MGSCNIARSPRTATLQDPFRSFRSCVKADGAYGKSVRSSLSQAVDALEARRGRLETCMTALSVEGVTRAQLWQAIRTVARRLLA